MSRRTITKRNLYPTYVGEDRHINSILRNKEGFIVKPIYTIDGQFVKYILTNIKDTVSIKPDNNGKRGRGVSRFLKSISNNNHHFFSDNNVVNNNYTGDLYMYCIHCPDQVLKPVSEFTTNKTQKTTICHDGLCRQSFCRDCKQTYVNKGDAGNSSRTKDQFIEDNGARLRGLLEIVLGIKPKIDYKLIWEKYEGLCFKCGEFIPFDKTDAKGLDHTLPHSKRWGLSNEDSTLLCSHKINGCNGSKSDKWPNIFYNDEQLVKLNKMTGIDLEIIRGEPHYNPDVVKKFIERFDDVLERWSDWGRYTRKHSGTNKHKEFVRYLEKEINKLKKFNSDKNVSKLVSMLEKYYGEKYE